MIGVGLFTQVAVIVAAVGVSYLAMSTMPSVFKNKWLSFLALAMLLSLLVTGPGGIAFDLPY